ncbi:3869_t:CDS:1, partial [Entrophospora sp. SA101]
TPTGNINEGHVLNKRVSCNVPGGRVACKASCAAQGHFGKGQCCPCNIAGEKVCRCVGNCGDPAK